jgi:glucokinase
MAEMSEIKSDRVGIEISASIFRAVAVGESGVVGASLSKSVDGPEPSADQLIDFIKGLRAEWGGFDRIGISVPGLVDPSAQRVAFSIHIPEHSGVDLVSEIHSATGVRAIIENDANAAAYGEYLLGAGHGSRSMFYVTLGEGVGGAFIFNGEIWHGAGGFAGEFGYVAINSEGTRLEDVASSANIIRRTRGRFHQDNTSSLNRMAEEAITLPDIIAAAEKSDDFSQMMLQRTGSYVGGAVANVINLLNIERIVVGGEIVKAKHLVLEAIVDRARELSFGPSFDSTNIFEGALGDNAAAIGVAMLSGKVV